MDDLDDELTTDELDVDLAEADSPDMLSMDTVPPAVSEHPFGVDLSAYNRKTDGPSRDQRTAAVTDAADSGGSPFGVDLSGYKTKAKAAEERSNAIAGLDPETYAPPVSYTIPSDNVSEQLPAVPGMDTAAAQRTLAISRRENPTEQARLFGIAGDIRNLYNLSKHFSASTGEDASIIAAEIEVPEGMVALMQKYEPDKLEARRIAAYATKLLEADDYVLQKLSGDPKYVAAWRQDMRNLADLQAAVNSGYASTSRIMWDWTKSAALNTAVDIGYGIPAAMSQAGREFREMGTWESRADIPIPEGLHESDPMAVLEIEAMNHQIRQQREEFESRLADPEFIAALEPSSQFLNSLDDWLQNKYQDASAWAHLPSAETGYTALDTGVRPIAQGLGSYVPSMTLGVLTGGSSWLPAIIFGASEAGSGYRERSKAGVDPITNAGISLFQMGGSALAEHFTIGKSLDQPGLKGFFRGMGGNYNTLRSRAGRVVLGGVKAGAGEAGAEGIQTGLELVSTPLAETISLGAPAWKIATAITGNVGTILESMWGGFGAGFIGGGTLGSAGRELYGARSYFSFQKGLETVAPVANELKQKKGDVKKVRGETRNILLDGIAKQKTDLTLTSFADGMDVERYCQTLQPAEADAFLESIGTNRAALDQALENQIDIEVPTENLLVPDGEVKPDYLKLFRSNPTMQTASFIQQQASLIDETFQLAERLQRTIEQDIEQGLVPERITTLYHDLRAMKIPAGEAKTDISLLWAYVQTYAAKHNLSVEEVADERVIRAATDAFIKNNPAWLAGVMESRRRTPDAPLEEGNAEFPADLDAGFDPAFAERVDTVPGRQQSGIGEYQTRNRVADEIVPFEENPGVYVTLPEQSDLADASGQPAPAERGQDAGDGLDSGRSRDGEQGGGLEAAEPPRSLFEAADIPQRSGAAVDKLTGLPFTLETTTTQGVKAAPELFQFKRSSNPDTGVKKGQELPGDVDPAALGTMVFFEDVDGDRFVVSGHHRLDLLRRRGEEAEIRAVILREREGWQPDQARAYGAALNIKEGGGDIDDYATFFRETRIERDQAIAGGLLRRENARTGYAIGALGGDNVYYGYLNEELSARHAAAIAEAAPGDTQLQDMMIARKIKIDELETFAGYVNQMRNSGKLNLSGVQRSLFAGTDYEAMLAVMEKESAAASKEAVKLEKQATSLEALVRAGKILSPAEMNRHGVRAGNKAGMADRAAQLREDAFRWKNFFQFPDVLAQVKDLAGTAVTGEMFTQGEADTFAQSADNSLRAMTDYGNFYDTAMNDRQANQPFQDMVQISQYSASLIKARLGLDVDGFTHGAEGSHVRHSDNRHGAGQEYRSGQGDIDRAAFELVPLIVNSPDNVYDGGETSYGKKRILFEKTLGETLYVVEEIREGKKRLAFITMWKKNSGESGVGQTSETSPPDGQVPRATDSPLDTIQPADGIVKPDDTFQQSRTQLNDIFELAKSLGIELEARERNGIVTLNKMIVSEMERGQGKETALLQQLIQYTEDTGQLIALTPSDAFGGSKTRLESWYKKLGFIENTGRNKLFSTQERFVRYPQNPMRTFYQGKPSQSLGEVDLYKATPQQRAAAIIRVMKNANRSTVPHEFAHIFFDDMRTLVESGKADNATLRDFGKLTYWAGRLTIDPTLEKGTPEYIAQKKEVDDNIEKVSRGLEQYLAEGRAPSVELINSFALFSSWFSRIYPDIRRYVGSELSDNVRGVYDRWFATERQIDEAEAFYGGRRGNSFINLLDDEEEKARLEERRRQRENSVRQRYAGDMVGAFMEAQAAREQVIDETKAEIDASREYQAIETARAMPLDRAGAVSIVGEQTVADIVAKHGNVFTKAIVMTDEDIIAELAKVGYFGEDTTRQFLTELFNAVPVEEAVKAQGSHGRRKRYYEAAAAIAKAGGMDMDEAIATVGEPTVSAIIEKHGGTLFSSGYTGIERMAAKHGFSSGDEMLMAMAKAPNAADLLEDTFQRKMDKHAAEARRWATDEVDHIADSALHNPQEDIEADTIDLHRQAIHRAMSASERRQQAYIDRRIITERARAHLNGIAVRKAANYSNWAMAERRWATRAGEAAAIGDRRGALEALDKQQYYHALVTESFRIRQERQSFEHRWSYRAARSGLGGVEYGFRQTMMDILHHYGIVKSRAFIPEVSNPDGLVIPKETDGLVTAGQGDQARLVDEDLNVFVQPIETLIPVWLRNKQMPENYINFGDLTVTQMREMDEALGLLQKRGRGELTALRSDQAATVEAKKRVLLDKLEELPDYKQGDPRSWWTRKKKSAEGFIVSNLLIDRIAAEADGSPMLKGQEMGEMQNMIGIIRNAESGKDGQMERLDTFHKESEADFAILDGFASDFKKLLGSKIAAVDGVEMPEMIKLKKHISAWDAEMIQAVFFNMGNRGNKYALQQGMGLSDVQLDILASLATVEQWQALERIGKRIEQFYPSLDEVYFRMTNRHLPRVEPTPFTVEARDGIVSLSGWYYPLVYDPQLSDIAGQQQEMAEFIAGMNAIYSPSKPVDGFTQGRAVDEDGNPVVARPPLLRMSVLVNHLTNMTRWVTHVEPLYEFRRITMDADFKEAFVRKLGEEKYRYLREWTNRMARPNKGASTPGNRAIGKMRNASTAAALGFNVNSALKQNKSFGIAADQMSKASRTRSSGWYWLLQGFKEVGLRGFLGGWVGYQSPAVRDMRTLSPEANMRSKNVNKEIREMTGGADPTRRRIRIGALSFSKDIFFHFTQAMDAGVSSVCWWGAYLQGKDGHAGFDTDGLTDVQIREKSIAYADSILRSQQSPFSADFTRLQADPGAISMFTQFMGGVTPYLSHTYGMLQETRRGNISKMDFVRTMINTYAIPVLVMDVMFQWLKDALRDDDDDEEKSLGADFAWGMVNDLTAPLPLVRDAVGVAQYGTRSALPPSLSLPAKFVSRSYGAAVKLHDGDIEAAASDFGKAVMDTLPMNQLLRQSYGAGQAIGVIEED